MELKEFRYLNVNRVLHNPFSHPNCNGNGENQTVQRFFLHEQIVSVVETVIHYSKRPIFISIRDQHIVSDILVPVAQHLCISLEDGVSRYEEVLRIVGGAENNIKCISLEHRWIRSNPTQKSTFSEVLSRSLAGITESFSDNPLELFLNRVFGRSASMDSMLHAFFNSSKEPIQAHFTSLMLPTPMRINFQMAAAPFALVGGMFPNPSKNVSVLLSNSHYQLFETLQLTFIEAEHKIRAFAFDSAISQIIYTPDNKSHSLVFLDAVSYWNKASGLSLITNNERVPMSLHPFCNFEYNPVLNRSMKLCGNVAMKPQTETPDPIGKGQDLDIVPTSAHAPGECQILRPVPVSPEFEVMLNVQAAPSVRQSTFSFTENLCGYIHPSRLNPKAEVFCSDKLIDPPRFRSDKASCSTIATCDPDWVVEIGRKNGIFEDRRDGSKTTLQTRNKVSEIEKLTAHYLLLIGDIADHFAFLTGGVDERYDQML